ncbi:MAG TPA: VIT1/CCC1 transporter family protein [Candidatus Bathyarchaeia archaeon]|jgi:predicted membrane protein (TIGR00267 family)|nr:VIT1/CCC1 transporter family protein [Candidatus Bathyarchaeia archaeon]
MSFSMLSIVNRGKLRKPLKEPHSSHSFLSDFILGSQDGLVNVLGILLGVSAATSDVRIIYVGALAALGAESISMGAVAYTSTLARRRQYQKEVSREQLEMKQVPAKELSEVRGILKGWGYDGRTLETMTDGIASNPKAMQEFMMSFELKLAPVEKDEARRSFAVVLSSTIFGSFIPLIPFFFVTAATIASGSIASVVISGALLFFIGAYEARLTVGSVWWSGLQMMIIGLSAGFAGYLIGRLVGAAPGL